MASSCSVCRAVGGNMKMCKKCNNVWCANCSRKGEGHYPNVNTPPLKNKYTHISRPHSGGEFRGPKNWWESAGFQSPLMVQFLTSAKNKFLFL